MKNICIRKWISVFLASAMAVTCINMPGVPAAAETVERAAVATEDDREVNFNKGWKFQLLEEGVSEEGMQEKEFDDSLWKETLLPHDFNITREQSNTYEAESGFYPGGVGWYRKSVVFPAEYLQKSLVLTFDGVYNHAYVYVNGEKIGENHYGYNDFSFDITEYVACDGKTENVIAVKAECAFPSSRWYSGGGIYRDVKLTVTDPVHVGKNGTYVTTPDLEEQQNGDVDVHVATDVQNDSYSSADATVRTTVLDADGKEVSLAVSDTVTVAAGEQETVEQIAVVSRPALWSCETPDLYYVKTEILSGGSVKDTYMTVFGFRYIKYEASTGFSLNGQNMKMKGVCMHHDQGALGAAAYRDAIYRQVRKLKEMGCNAIRTSHNTPADVLLDACNELGMLVMDETYDGWAFGKNDNTQDFNTHFNQTIGSENLILGAEESDTWYKFVLESNIDRDKNDPSVVMWDIGNELNFGVTDSSRYVEYTRNMIQYINAIDDTRPITCGDNNPAGNVGSNPTDFRNKVTAELVKAGGIAGMNYSMGAIANVHNSHPDWKIVATETASPSNSRGIYDTTGHYGRNGDYQCTSYDTDWVSWGNSARESWYYTIKDDFVAGEFIWTGFDYIGEPTPWNGTKAGSASGDSRPVPNSSYFGVFDTAGFPKDSFYFYTSQWREDDVTLHLVPQSWNEEDLAISGGKVPVYIYSNAEKVELYLNDELIGTSTRNVTTTEAGYEWATYSNVSNDSQLCTAVNQGGWRAMAAQFNVQYEAGTLYAIAYDRAGRAIKDTLGLDSVTTNSDKGTVLKMEAEKEVIQADGSSLSYISVDVEDEDGRLVSAARNNIRFTLSGNGTIVGVDNGNPSTVDKFQQKSVLTSARTANIDAFGGKALVIVRSTERSGGFKLNAVSSGLESASVFVNTVGGSTGGAFTEHFEITEEYTVTMGQKPQLQSEVSCMMSDGSTAKGTITWTNLTEQVFNTPGDHTVEGVLKVGTEEISVSVYLHVKPIIVKMKNYSRAVMAGIVPVLPETVAGFLPDGRLYGAYPVTWDSLKAEDLQKVGKIVTVNGTAVVEDGKTMPVTATIRVAETVTAEPRNIAPDYATLTESCGQKADNLLSITNGVKDILDSPQERWTNYNDHLTNSSPTITFTWEDVQEIAEIKAWFFGNHEVEEPESVTIEVSADGVNFNGADFTHGDYVVNTENVLTLSEAQRVKALRFTMKQQGTGYVGLTELEIWSTSSGYETNHTAVLDALAVNGKTVPGFTAGEFNGDGYAMDIDNRLSQASVTAAAKDNASVNIIPADSQGVARVVVESEDGAVVNTYVIRLRSLEDEAIARYRGELTAALTEAASKKAADFTADSWAGLQTALTAAQAVNTDPNATSAQLAEAVNRLKAAIAGLKAAAVTPPAPVYPKVGTTHKVKKASYKITASSAKSCTVTFVKPISKNNKKFTVPATVKIGAFTYKVTKIDKKAFKNNKKLTNVTVGKYVTAMGASAFEGASKLKKITIQSKGLKTVGKKALKGISSKATIQVPKGKAKAYKKTFKNKGQKSSVKIK